MADLILPSGQEITFDLNAITTQEYRDMYDPKKPDKSGDKTLAKACGISADELAALPLQQYKHILAAFFRRCNDPVADPNDWGNGPS